MKWYIYATDGEGVINVHFQLLHAANHDLVVSVLRVLYQAKKDQAISLNWAPADSEEIIPVSRKEIVYISDVAGSITN